MKKKNKLKKKISLLLISLEIININNIYKEDNTEKNINKNIKFKQLTHDFKNCYQNQKHSFIETLKNIYIIYKTISINTIDQKAQKLLRNYIKNENDQQVKQYLKKFHYIYFIKTEYYHQYKSLKYLNKININKVAITNLYIISKLNKRIKIFFLIKYLFKYKYI
uniref:Uncharacterized protein n=1 Tax=Lophocladia kuetzingii TaxID=675577 RepID=A0A1Z1MP85_9FLOR|nr:hypothetical protein [Lophocladia kuetzingii]ARW67756.1 hypothetical protein [Lophocladia kuetzingii]